MCVPYYGMYVPCYGMYVPYYGTEISYRQRYDYPAYIIAKLYQLKKLFDLYGCLGKFQQISSPPYDCTR